VHVEAVRAGCGGAEGRGHLDAGVRARWGRRGACRVARRMTIQLLQGDCRTVLPTLAANSVQCVVTSPPYYGLRDYGTAQWDGGDAECQHSVARTSERGRVQHDVYAPPSGWTNRDATPPRLCSCGARRIDAQIGLEATPDAFIAQMVAVFREVKRVLRPDGVLFLNLGDSYAGGPQQAAARSGEYL